MLRSPIFSTQTSGAVPDTAENGIIAFKQEKQRQRLEGFLDTFFGFDVLLEPKISKEAGKDRPAEGT